MELLNPLVPVKTSQIKILILYYSQAGQTHRAVQAFVAGLTSAALIAGEKSAERSIICDTARYSVEPDFNFPWTASAFFAAFPRCHLGPLPNVLLPAIEWSQYDRVILASQVWFLAPSLPMQAFLAAPAAKNLRGQNVLTLVTCRNLWQSAFQNVVAKLQALGANHLGQITICETSPLWESFVTTPRWMLTGKKNAFAIFSPAGIAESEFLKLEGRARALGDQWLQDPQHFVNPTHDPIYECNLNRVSLLLMDHAGIRFFRVWAAILRGVARNPGVWQNLWLIVFRLTLVMLILLLMPFTKLIEICVGHDPRWFRRPVLLPKDNF